MSHDDDDDDDDYDDDNDDDGLQDFKQRLNFGVGDSLN